MCFHWVWLILKKVQNNIFCDLWMAPFSEDTNESQKIEHENDPEEDKAEIKEFLRKVRSHGSFKIIIGKWGQTFPRNQLF